LTPLATPRRAPKTAKVRALLRSDEAVINQWLLDQSTPARRPASRPRPSSVRRSRLRGER